MFARTILSLQKQVTFATLNAAVAKKLGSGSRTPVIVDVREPEEVSSTGSIPTAINIPLGHVNAALRCSPADFEKQFKAPKPESKDEVVFYCLKGMRAQKAQSIAAAEGFNGASVYPGSWEEWSRLYKTGGKSS